MPEEPQGQKRPADVIRTTNLARKAARILGLVWMAAVIATGLLLWERNAQVAANIFQMRYAYGLIALVFFAMLPGYLIFRWGKGPFRRNPWPSLRPKAPYDRAAEAGHVMRIDPRA